MSGGHFDYNCFRIKNFAEDLAQEIENNDTDVSGHGATGFSQTTIARLKTVHRIIDTAADLAHTTEWLYSGDSDEVSFQEKFDKILAEALKK